LTIAAGLFHRADANGRQAAGPKVKQLQTKRATRRTIASWFRGNSSPGIGVIFGEISGGLVSRDFDELAAYEAWAASHPDMAATLPTVETSRGRHVYCRADVTQVKKLRSLLGKPEGTGAIKFADGELRCGVGCYSVLPPSQHPSGHIYRWIVPLPDGPLPEVDLLAAGFVPAALIATESNREDRGLLKTTEAMKGVCVDCTCAHLHHGSVLSVPLCRTEPTSDLDVQVERAIRESLPTGPGKRNENVFELARTLKAIPALADTPVKSLRPIVERWHSLALPQSHEALRGDPDRLSAGVAKSEVSQGIGTHRKNL
jgi:hypothetical protein